MREVIAHYEAGLGIRPPRKSGKVRGVAREVVPGGGMELWSCDHDHAPSVRSCLDLTRDQHAEATRCARDWLATQIHDGHLTRMPVRDEGEGEDAIVIPIPDSADPVDYLTGLLARDLEGDEHELGGEG